MLVSQRRYPQINRLAAKQEFEACISFLRQFQSDRGNLQVAIYRKKFTIEMKFGEYYFTLITDSTIVFLLWSLREYDII